MLGRDKNLEDPEELLYKAAKQMLHDKKADPQWAGFCTSFGAAATSVFAFGAQHNMNGTGPEELTYALGASALYGAGYTINNALDLKWESAGEFTKGFLAPPLLAASFYVSSENIDWSSEPQYIDDEKTLTISQDDLMQRQPLSEDCWDREGLDHKLVCYGLNAALGDSDEQPDEPEL